MCCTTHINNDQYERNRDRSCLDLVKKLEILSKLVSSNMYIVPHQTSCEGEFPYISFSLALLFVHYVHFLPLWCKKETWLYYFCKYHFFPKVNLNSPCSESYLWVSLVGIVNLWSTPSLTLRSYSLWFLPLNLSFFFFFAPIPRHFFFTGLIQLNFMMRSIIKLSFSMF